MHYGILGIDWGASKVGVAVADTETRLALAVGVYKNDNELLDQLDYLVGEYDVKLAIVGIPSRINREEVVYGGEQLGAILEKRLGLRVEYQNEMFTTKMARQNLMEQGLKNLDRYDDQEAARLILQSWLETHNDYDIL